MMGEQKLRELIADGEKLEVEFKSDKRTISDNEIYEEVVAMANTHGGVLLIGVEDDGSISGAHPRHDKETDPLRLKSAIFNNTVPNINTFVEVISIEGDWVIAISVDQYPEPCAVSSGKALKRQIKSDGKPETVPFYPRDQRSARIDLGLIDFSSQLMSSATFSDLDPIGFEILKKTISSKEGDQALLRLNNEEIAKALRVVESKNGELVPNIAGLLLLGNEKAIRDHLPTHSVHFQVIDQAGNVKANETFAENLLQVIAEVEMRFSSRIEEKEIVVGMIRLPVPNYSIKGFREAFLNALLHRDYSRMEGIYFQWHPDHLLITNPGGFPEGITINNILTHEPKPRNVRLAESFKRIGLIEQTGRGVDKIYSEQLRYGRLAPDYSRSDSTGVRLVLSGGQAVTQFAAFCFEQDKQGASLSLDEMIILNALLHERRIDSDVAGGLIQKGTSFAHRILESLHDRGFVEGKGEKKGRIYHLSAALYRRLGLPAGYVRAHGIDPVRHEEMIITYLGAHGKIERKNVMDLCGINGDQASRLLRRMVEKKKIIARGSPPRWVFYELNKKK